MDKVYLSFLGLGQYNEKTKTNEYRKTIYELNGKNSNETEFVQVAEIEILGWNKFDKILIIATQVSYDAHFNNLSGQMVALGVNKDKIIKIIIEDNMASASQWRWFEKILQYVSIGDELTFDLTHGYRAIPIILSTAINFLQKAKGIKLQAVYYGAFEKNKELAPIINMKDFYIINEWAEGVSRLIEDADARKLGQVAELSSVNHVPELNDKKVIKAFDDLTNCIRNVDVNNVSEKANEAIKLINEKLKKATGTGKILLETVYDKFVSLTTQEPVSGLYDRHYFCLQLEIIKMLLEHKLFMQAYTVMREFIASIGMISLEKTKVKNKTGRRQRVQYAEVFLKMLEISEPDWKFGEASGNPNNKNSADRVEELKAYYYQLEKMGIVEQLRIFTKELTDYRNGFDHAWTAKSGIFNDIEEKGNKYLIKLKAVLSSIELNKLL